jgi:hypothetical protein
MLPHCVLKRCAKESVKDIAAWYVSMKIGVFVRHWMVQKLDNVPRLTYKPQYPRDMEDLFKPQEEKTPK